MNTKTELHPGTGVSVDLYGGTIEGFVMWRVDGMVSYGGHPFYRVKVIRTTGTRPEKFNSSVVVCEASLTVTERS